MPVKSSGDESGENEVGDGGGGDFARRGAMVVAVVVRCRGGGDLRRMGEAGCGWGVSGISRAGGSIKSFD